MTEQNQVAGPKATAPGATLALVLAIVGLFGVLFFGILGVILGAIAIWQGRKAKGLIRDNLELGGGGRANAGIIIGIIDIVFGLFAFLLQACTLLL